MKPIRIALIGANTNSHCVQIHTRIQSLTDIFEVVGIAYPENEEERLPKKVEKIGDLPRLTLEQILNDPTVEAVAIETDEIYCTKYALMAAKAGKHIHMEKPGGRELADFEELIATVKEKNLVFCPGYMYRYNPYVQELFSAIEKGELGEVQYVEAQMNCIHKPEVRQWLDTLPGGMMFFLGCHLVDLIYRIQGKPLQVLPLNCRSGIGAVDSKDQGMVIFRYPHGVSFAKTTATERGGHRRRQLVVTGTKATWEIKPLERGREDAMITARNISAEGAWSDPGVDSVTEPFDRYIPMLTHFARCVRGEIENEFTPDYELELFKLLLACCEE